FTAQTPGTQGTQPALMGKLSQWVGLVHKLGQLAAAEEFLDGSGNRTDVYKRLRGYNIHILYGHPFLDNPFHSGQADAELVLQKLSHGTKPAVAQMVDIVYIAYAVCQVQVVTYGSNNIIYYYVLGNQLVNGFSQNSYQLFPAQILIQNFL